MSARGGVTVRVVRGSPDAVELASLVAVLSVLARRREDVPDDPPLRRAPGTLMQPTGTGAGAGTWSGARRRTRFGPAAPFDGPPPRTSPRRLHL